MKWSLPPIVIVFSLFLIGCTQEIPPKTVRQAPELAMGETSPKTIPSAFEQKLKVEEASASGNGKEEEEQPTSSAPKKDDSFEELPDGVQLILDPTNLLAPVNKRNTLPADYKPSNLVAPNIPFYFSEDIPKRYMREDAAKAVEELFKAAKEDGINLVAASGYRSYSRQKDIFQAKARQVGKEAANQVVAYPGQSEHQTGLAIDITTPSLNYKLEEEFGLLPEGMWLAENAHKHGFIIRYLKGKEKITGYQYEPWHIRYVGIEEATTIYEKGWTLEEYLEAQ